jgi:hypothetical protein
MRSTCLLLIALFALLNTGCEKDNPAPLPTDILSFWKFEGYGYHDQIEFLPDSINIDLYIGSVYSRGNDFEGESSFRNYWGRFILDKDEIHFYDLRVTDVMTVADSISWYQIERKYLNALIKGKEYVVDNDLLTIYCGGDSSLIFSKDTSTIYSDKYEMSNQFDGQEWRSDSSFGARIDRNYTDGYYYCGLYGLSEVKHSDGQYYELGIQIYYPPKKGIFYENSITSIHAYSFPAGDPNTSRSESSSGYLRIDRVSRRFIIGEFEFHMVRQGLQPPGEFNIVRGKFKAGIYSSGLSWYISYN